MTKASPEARAPANPTSFAILFIAANNQLQSPSAEDDVLSSAGRDQIAADEDEPEEHQDERTRASSAHDYAETPGKRPVHSAFVLPQLRARRPRHRPQHHAMVGQVHGDPVEPVRDRRAGRTPGGVVGPEHEMIDEELRAPSE